jgi:parallel beta-helix repeat protein
MHPFKTVLLCLALTCPLYAADIHVPGDYPTIQQAIDAAVNGDTVLVDPGTYVENIDYIGKAITVAATGAPEQTVIDGGQPADTEQGSVVIFTNGEGQDAILEGFSLTNGTGMVFTFQSYGGAVYCEGSSPTLRNNIIKNNTALHGAAIYCENGSSVVELNSIMWNDGSNGAVIYCEKAGASIDDNEIAHNSGVAIHCHDKCYGFIRDNKIHHNEEGAIHCSQHSFPVIIYNTIEYNTTFPVPHRSGGILMESSSSIIARNTIRYNKTHHRGGGIACYQESHPLIEENTISGNEAFLGGGISVSENAYPRIAGNTIRMNTAERRGGGIECHGILAEIHDNTIEDNIALYEGGGICLAGVDDWVHQIHDNSIAGNRAFMGGGVAILDCPSPSISMIDNEIAYNTAKGLDQSEGGGIFVRSSNVQIIGNYIYANTSISLGTSAAGGGVFCRSSTVDLVNCRIIDNTVGSLGFSRGGGLYGVYGSMKIANCTVFHNAALSNGSGGGGYFDGVDTKIVNTIAWNNNADSNPQLDGGSIQVMYSDIQDGWIGDGNIDADPLFVGEAEEDFHLRHDSPCRATGTWNFAGLSPTDFEGDPRIGDGLIDMGADEFHPHLYNVGSAVPGGTVEGRMIGWPGTSPVDLWFGSAVLDPPVQTMYGYWYLGSPLIGPISLGPMPASGVRTISAVIPLTIPPPYDVPMQALLFDKLSNLCVLEVR